MIEFKPGNLRVPKWSRPVYMVAAGTTDYRKRYPEYKLEELCMMAFRMLLEENDLKLDPLEVKGLINFAGYGEFADHFQDQLLCEAKVHDYLGLDPLPNVGVKTGGATGGSTMLAGATTIASGYRDCTLVLGWERMDEVKTWTGNYYIATAACKDFETRLARMYASYYAPMARRFQEMYNVDEHIRAEIAVQQPPATPARHRSRRTPASTRSTRCSRATIVSDPLRVPRVLRHERRLVRCAALLRRARLQAHRHTRAALHRRRLAHAARRRPAPMQIPLLPNDRSGLQ